VDSPKDGSILDSKETILSYKVPYRLVKVFYSNTKLNPEMIDCAKVFPVERRLDSKFFASETDYIVETLKLFLKGPTEKEKGEGYGMTAPSNLTINFVKVFNKEIQVDFGKELFEASGGSCRVLAIRAEITETVQQFFPGYQVIISANGNSEEVLQP
jgi:spore germination protein GerM